LILQAKTPAFVSRGSRSSTRCILDLASSGPA
jgi:hypothetical protein